MILLVDDNIILDGLRAICALLDRIIYGTLIPLFYDYIIEMANIQAFQDSSIQDFATRVYSLMALFMLFKITFSFITYIVNPDQMTDKTKGAGNIIKKVIIVLILIIITPRAFSLLREAQGAILDDQILPKFILGKANEELYGEQSARSLTFYKNEYKIENYNGESIEGEICETASGMINAATAGDYISLMIFKNFYKVDVDIFGAKDVDVEAVESELESNYCPIVDGVVVDDYLDSDIYNSCPGVGTDYYMIDYWIIISTAVGVVVALMLLSTIFDVSVRAIKLGFLELISPVPIISYLEPKSGENGMFKKWLSEVGKTWASLFIRLASIFFFVYVVSELSFLEYGDNDKYGFLIELFLIIGALMFAKQLPKLIENILGISTDGGFQLNPFKKISNEALGGKFLAAGAAAGAVGIAGGIAGGIATRNAIKDTGGKFAGLRGALGGIGAGFRSAGKTVMTGSDGSLSSMNKAMGTGFAAAGRGAQNIYAKDGTSFSGRTLAGMQTKLGLKTEADKNEDRFKRYDAFEKQMKVLDDRSEDYLKKHSDLTLKNGKNYGAEKKIRENILNGNTISDANIAARNNARKRIAAANSVLSSSTASRSQKNAAMKVIGEYSDLANSYTAAEQVQAQTQLSAIEKEAKQLARMKLLSATGSDRDAEFDIALHDIENNNDYADLYGYSDIMQGLSDERNGNYSTKFKDGRAMSKTAHQRESSSEINRQAQANKAYATRNKK